MTNSIILQNVSTEQLENLISESVKSQLENFKKELNHQSSKEELLSREQVLELLQINPSTLWHWQNKGRITAYKFANKCYYKKAELLESLTAQNK